MLRALFQQIADPGRLKPLGLTEVLDWTAAALGRVDRSAFFARFNQGEAVPYFYEPFLEAFDPDLRKQLGVWYTPSEVVRYMVARVDRALKDDLRIPDGLAAENVYVLDPCCGTGAYLAEVLRRIAANLAGRGLGALVGAGVKQAAMQRVFGFEIMPAPFVVAHLQVGLTMQDLDAPLADDGAERRRLPHERADRLGAPYQQAAALPGIGGGTRPRRAREAGAADPRDPRQSALQRLRGHGGGRGAGPTCFRCRSPASRPAATDSSSMSISTGFERVRDYFDPGVSHEEIGRHYPGVMRSTARFDACATRTALLARGGPDESGFVRFAYRPFDTRWLYWEKDTKLLDEKRAEYRPHVFEGNLWLVFQNKARPDLSPPLAIRDLGDLNQMNSGIYCVPALLGDGGLGAALDQQRHRPNLSGTAQSYLERLDADALDLVHHVIAVLHEPTYNRVNADALRAEGPRIPLPGWGEGGSDRAAAALARSAARGRELARLLDADAPVSSPDYSWRP